MSGDRRGRRRVALTVAGSDSGGGAGVAADLKTFEACGVWGALAVTAVTAQNTVGVQRVAPVDPAVVLAQITSVRGDLDVRAAKTGMLAGAATVTTVAGALGGIPLVVDPVVVSSSGTALLDPEGVEALRSTLLPLAALVTPNLAEAAVLSGMEVADADGMVRAGRALVAMGAGAALVTGGHGTGVLAVDCLVEAGGEPMWLEAPRQMAGDTHGTGCVLSAAICAHLAIGRPLAAACREAKALVGEAIAGGAALGTGPGAVDPGCGPGRFSSPA